MTGVIQGDTFLYDPLSPTLPFLFTQHYQERIHDISRKNFFAAYKKALENITKTLLMMIHPNFHFHISGHSNI